MPLVDLTQLVTDSGNAATTSAALVNVITATELSSKYATTIVTNNINTNLNNLTDTVNTISGNENLYKYGFIEVTKTNTGTEPLLVTKILLRAGTYTTLSATFGTTSGSATATLQAKTSNGTVLRTLTRTGEPIEVSDTGFTLVSDTLVGFYLYGSASNTLTYVFNVGVS